MSKVEVAIGQVWRDRDKRMSSGHRHVRIVAAAVKGGEPAFVCVRVARLPGGPWRDIGAIRTDVRERTLRSRFALVQPPQGDTEGGGGGRG